MDDEVDCEARQSATLSCVVKVTKAKWANLACGVTNIGGAHEFLVNTHLIQFLPSTDNRCIASAASSCAATTTSFKVQTQWQTPGQKQ